jgi:hypothetical protein
VEGSPQPLPPLSNNETKNEQKIWKQKLLPFLVPNETLNKLGEDVYGFREKGSISFWFEGGLKVSGNNETLSVNFKDEDLLVLSTLMRKTIRIYRIPYARLVSFELTHSAEAKAAEPELRFFRN